MSTNALSALVPAAAVAVAHRVTESPLPLHLSEEHSPSLLVVNVSIMTVYCALLLTLLWLRRAPPDTEGENDRLEKKTGGEGMSVGMV